MSTPPDEELKRWKDRYFSQAEEFEQQEKSLQDYIHLLQRVLVRVSLAAEGLDSRLDKELDSLRKLLKKENSAHLTHQLDQIERAVLRLDDDKQLGAERMLDGLMRLVDQLHSLELSRDQKRQLKDFSRQIKTRLQSLREYPNLLSEFANLQAQAFQEQFDRDPNEINQAGFFRRLFSGSRNLGAAAATEEPKAGAEAEADDFALRPIASSEPDPLSGETGFSAISEHVCNVLTNLVEQLSLPESATKEADKLRTTIRSGLNWYELGPTLDDVANLVISAVGKGQREFESFLKSLDNRLATLQSVMTEGQNFQRSLRRSNNQLDQVVREQVESISTSVREATDLEVLKVSVKSNLDTIIHSMDEFVRNEESREAELNRQMEALQQRLVSMEQESESVRQRLQMERTKALTDMLTGLPNREAYDERLQQEFERFQRYGNPLSLVMCDIDLFKRINDQFGHLAGDKVIQIVAKEVRRRIRRTDFVARYGGEEFVILLPETSQKDALPVMDKTREMIQKLPFHFRNERVEITMSFGLCDFRQGLSALAVFDLADQALYQAKQQGRNRVVTAD